MARVSPNTHDLAFRARLVSRARRLARAPRSARASLALIVLVAASVLSGCPCVGTMTDMSPGLRWWLFSKYGAEAVCPEMVKQGVALHLDDAAPAMGRFFPAQCSYTLDDVRQTITVNVAGTGYGFVAPAKRVGFSVSASVEFRPDFRIIDDDMYVWAVPNRVVSGPTFQVTSVENPLVDLATNFPPFGSLTATFGNQVVAAELNRGFTVIHNVDRGNDFTLGILQPPARPLHPFAASDTSRYTFANETVDIHGEQRDYLGPFEITTPGQSLFLTMSVAGPSVDVMIVTRPVGDAWRDAYQTGKTLGPPPALPVAGGPVAPGVGVALRYPLPPGQYYVVVDNTAAAGLVAPPPLGPLGDAVARVSYLAELGR